MIFYKFFWSGPTFYLGGKAALTFIFGYLTDEDSLSIESF